MSATYSIPVNGPDPALAYLRALALKAAAAAGAAWARIRSTASLLFRLGRAAAETGLAVLATDLGYRAATALARRVAATAWRGLRAVVAGAGRAAAWLGRAANRAVAAVSPGAASWLGERAQRIAAPVAGAWQRIDAAVKATGEVLWYLLHTPLVRRATTVAAQTASVLLLVHAVSRGAVAAEVVAMVPASMDLVIAVTNPALALAAVAAVAGAAAVVALVRLLAQPDSPDGGPDDDPSREDEPGDDEPDAPEEGGVAPLPRVAEVLHDLQAVAAKVRVEVKPDGSVVVHGIPADVPPELGRAVAEIATDAVQRHLRRILPVRPTPSRDDRRLFTKAAREAIAAEARRRQREADEAA